MEMALNYDLFMDADMMMEEVVTDGNVVGLNSYVTTSNAHNPQIKIVKNEIVPDKVDNLEIKIVELDLGNIHIAKIDNKKSENEIKNIEREMMKGYMKLLSNFEK